MGWIRTSAYVARKATSSGKKTYHNERELNSFEEKYGPTIAAAICIGVVILILLSIIFG